MTKQEKKQYDIEYREKFPDKIKDKSKKYYEKNKEKIINKQKEKRESLKNNDEYNVKVRAIKNKSYKKNKDKINERAKTAEYRYSDYKRRAQTIDRVFDLSKDKFKNIFESPCTYCSKEQSHGIDRKDNNVGYTEENCLPCCWTCNRMKGNLSVKVFLQHIEKIKTRYYATVGQGA